MAELYYIFCKDRSHDGIACWWRSNRCGYTTDLEHAGKYTKAEADQIEKGSGGDDFGISQFVIDTLETQRIVRMDWGANWQAFKRLPPRPPQGKSLPTT